ncbi:MAG: SDR family oxidoreductase [Clostridia bacterium]|nr:SDR family oxidoreductase [Clostridia bacterium]
MIKCWFDYKTVIVTGASSGIGKGIVKKLIQEHCCNVIGIARNETKIKALIEELGSNKAKFSYYLFDVSKRENWENFAAEIEKNNIQPDVLINNAGILPKFDKFAHYSMEDIESAMNINFYSCVYSMRCMIPILLKSDSAGIVNIASSAALCSLAGTSVYSASKAALKSLTGSIREEYRGRLYIGLVCPGFTKTDIFHNQKGTVDSKGEKALNLVSSDCEKMVDAVINGMWKKRSDMVFGIDAHLMSAGTKILGVNVSRISSKVLKMSKLDLFADVFTE